jgi:histidinol phosphatase-like PHP family hydrolase
MNSSSTSRPREYERFDFHCHTYLTDGETSATEMWRYAHLLRHRVLAVTDHIATEDPTRQLNRLREEAQGWEERGILPIIGVEVTHVPPSKIPDVVRTARRSGAEIVLVHGETIAEEVAPGTNRAALETGEVDILAHPGLLTREEAELARDHGSILELSGRRAHSMTNGLVAKMAIEVGVPLVVDSDAHSPNQLLSAEAASRIALGAGVELSRLRAVLEEAPRALVRRLGRSL